VDGVEVEGLGAAIEGQAEPVQVGVELLQHVQLGESMDPEGGLRDLGCRVGRGCVRAGNGREARDEGRQEGGRSGQEVTGYQARVRESR
jgi:hypothetical protein